MSQMTLTKRIWRNLVWFRISWEVWYRIGWIVAWLRIYFRCNTLCWWVMQWWRRVTCIPISKYWLSVYQSIYRWFCYLFYCTNIVWIMYWSYVFESAKMGWFKLVWFGSTWIKSEYFLLQFRINLLWFKFTEFLRPTFSASKLFLRSAILKVLLTLSFSNRFSLSIFIIPCHRNPATTKLKMPQFLSLVLVEFWWLLMGLFQFFHPRSAWNQR